MEELLFLIGFSVHNIEEALWLPAWSKRAKAYHKEVRPGEFRFGVAVVTTIGALLTFLRLIAPASGAVLYAYSGFVGMMVLNAAFPHLVATVALRRYAPGLATALALNVPIGLYLLLVEYRGLLNPAAAALAVALVSVAVVSLLKPLFRIGSALFDKD